MGIASLHPSYDRGSAPLGHWPTTPAMLRPQSRRRGTQMVYGTFNSAPYSHPIYCQNRLETLRTSDVGTIDRR
jgi:hypothetical protein